jgi:hypothetical protein
MPTAARTSFLRRHAGFIALLLAAAPAFFAFAWQRSIATLGDDSTSYLLLAQHIAPGTPAIVERWVGLRANFPPLFPLVLALTGGAYDLLVGHLVVAAFAVLALVAVHAYALLRLGSRAGALAVAALFLLTPNAWVSMKGILSEPMFLFVSVATLAWYARRLEGRPGSTADWLAFGVLLACAYLTRAAAVALLLGYIAHAAFRGRSERSRTAWRLVLPLLPVAVLVGLWLAWRPVAGEDAYRATTQQMIAAWIAEPLPTLRIAAQRFLDGWIASFLAQSGAGAVARALFAALGAFALAGTLRAVRANRLDGWYVLASVAITFGWVFSEDNTRRLFYPIVPLLMIHAGELALALAARLTARLRRLSLAALAALPALLCLPAAVVLAQKALDRQPMAPGARHALADCVDLYTTIGLQAARVDAAYTLAAIEGLESIAEATPEGARVMWMRPEYVALLGHREGVPYLYSWDERRFARELLDQRVDYLVVSAVYKTDDANRYGEPGRVHPHVGEYARPVLRIRNVVNGAEAFRLMQVDRGAVERFLGSAPDAR